MKFTPREAQVLKDYGILDDAGQPVMVTLKEPVEKPKGLGPLVAEDALARLLKADPTPDKTWLPWIMDQAAGGEKARRASEKAMEQTAKRFIEERVNGYQNPKTKEYYKPVTRAEAEARWEKSKRRFMEVMRAADQDIVEKLGFYGFYRDWPGQSNLYEKTVNTITRFLQLMPKLIQMNKEVRQQAGKEQPATPDAFKTPEEMDAASKKIERYFASKVAREDIRLSAGPGRADDLIYDDDHIKALAPLTYAAAVRFGWKEWNIADPGRFNDTLSTDHSYSDQWKQGTNRGDVYVYLFLKAPAPMWVGRTGGTFKKYALKNLMLVLNRQTLKNFDPDQVVVFDEENQNTRRLGDIRTAILNEPTRKPESEETDELPIKRGANVYSTKEEAEKVVWHLDKAVEAVVRWAKHFDPATIKSDAMGKE